MGGKTGGGIKGVPSSVDVHGIKTKSVNGGMQVKANAQALQRLQKMAEKMHFFLSSMSVMYVLTTHMPEDGGNNPIVEQFKKRAK
nr:chloroplast acyl-acylcarrier protein thioesterase B [Tanacetum cinerariifolium]